jgi:hypothetical protein
MSEQVWVSWEAAQHVQGYSFRPATGMYATWALWAVGLVLGIVLLVHERSSGAARAQLAAT